MKFLYPFVIILVFTFLGELLNYFLPLPIPASIWGLLLLFAALRLGMMPAKRVSRPVFSSIPLTGMRMMIAAIAAPSSISEVTANSTPISLNCSPWWARFSSRMLHSTGSEHSVVRKSRYADSLP